MRHRIKILLFGLTGVVILGGFTCPREGVLPDNTFALQNWQAKWLDNRGAAPLLAADTLARRAFGLRVSATMRVAGVDSFLHFPYVGERLVLEKSIQKIRISTLWEFDGLPPGTDISDRFQLRLDDRDDYRLQYFSVDFSLHLLNAPPLTWGTDYYTDFLMTAPPSGPGLFECAVKITFDSTTLPPLDTLLTLPPVFLQ